MATRGVITFVFDDGYTHIKDHIVPLLDTHRMPGVFAIPLDQRRIAEELNLPMTAWQEWLEVRKTGHEIAAHSATHQDLATLSQSELDKELAEPKQLLQATTLVYPGGSYNDTVVTATKKYYQAARTVKRGLESIPPNNPWQLSTINFSRRNFSLLKTNLLALAAWVTDSWLIETYHIIDDTSPHTHAISRQDFAKHLKFVARLPIAVKTIRAVTTPTL